MTLNLHSIKRTIFFGIFLASCTSNNPDITFQYVDPLEKIVPEQNVFYPYAAEAEVARGEHATLQFVVRSPERIQNLTVRIKPTFQKDSTTLHAIDVTVYHVEYVHEGRAPQFPCGDLLYTPSRFYPDKLTPPDHIDVAPNVNTMIWLSIPIPTDTKSSREKESESGKRFHSKSRCTPPLCPNKLCSSAIGTIQIICRASPRATPP